MIYLDSAATTMQKPAAVAGAMGFALAHMASPGRGGHRPAMLAGDTAFRCRQEAAELFHLDSPEKVVFTFNATHALNLAIKTLAEPGDTVLISGYEHNAVTRPLHAIPDVTVKVAAAPPFDQGAMLGEFSRLMTPEVTLVVCTHVSNVFGFILPIEGIAALCRQRGKRLIVDASQSAGTLPVHMDELGADFIAMPGHKGLYGPQGTGLLLCGREDARPLLEGGTGSVSLRQDMPEFLPDRLEAGTHNIAGIAGLLEGLRFLERRGIADIAAHETALIRRAGEGLRAIPRLEAGTHNVTGIAGLLEGIRYVRRKGERRILNHERRLIALAAEGLRRQGRFTVFAGEHQAGVCSFVPQGSDCETLGEKLGERGIALRSGLHCAPLAHQTAGTLDTGTLRLSVSAFNREEEITCFLRELRAL